MSVLNRILFLLLFFVAACAKDRTLEDYDREKLSRDLARYQSIAGTYTGTVDTSNRPKEGKSSYASPRIQLVLEPATDIVGAKNQERSTQRPVLRGELRLAAEQTAILSFSDAAFDVETGAFQITIPVATYSGEKRTIELKGVIQDDVIEGGIETVDRTLLASPFRLTRGGELSSTPVDTKQVVNRWEKELFKVYVGEGDFLGKKKSRSDSKADRNLMIIYQVVQSMEERALEILSPGVRPVDIILSADRSAQISYDFSNSRWDRRTGTLFGSLTIPGSRTSNEQITYALNCQEIEEEGHGVWDCLVTDIVRVRQGRMKYYPIDEKFGE